MDSFLEGPHSDELEAIESENLMEDVVDFVDFDMDEYNTCIKDGIEDRGFEDDVPF